MEIVIIIIAVILIIAAFFLGRSQIKPIEDNNNKIRQEKEELQNSISKLLKEQVKLNEERNKQESEWKTKQWNANSELAQKEWDLKKAEDKLQSIDKQYQDKLQVIQNTEQLAKEAYDKNMEVYARKMLDKETEFQETIQKKRQELDLINQELNSLKETKAAAIKAANKETSVRENKDEFALILPKEEWRDIPLLRDVQYKISKPRAIAMCIWNGYYQPIAKNKFPKILGKQDVCGIYKITNQKTNECYIGQAVDVRKRWYEHSKAMIGIDAPQGNLLYAAAQEYGIENFTFELLLECDASELNEKEKYFIELYNSNTFGYNKTAGNN